MQNIKRPLKISVTVLAALLLIPLVFISLVRVGAFGHLQTRDELLRYKNATASLVLSSSGDQIGRFYSENRTNVSYEQLPANLINAVVATEDARFFSHRGVDARSLVRVLFKTVLSGNRSSGGGSTLSQQLAKNMYGRRNYPLFTVFINKTREVLLARRIEKVLSKEEILTLYLNTVSFGENIYGIETASQRFFDRRTPDLKTEEAAVLAGILKGNTIYNPRLYPDNSLRRRNVVIRQMEKYGYLDLHDADSLVALPLGLKYNNTDVSGPADYFMVRLRQEATRLLTEISPGEERGYDLEKDGMTIVTTLNLSLQLMADDAFSKHLSVMQKRLDEQYAGPVGRRELASVPDSLRREMTRLHAGLLALDPATGAVLAWVGGTDFRRWPYDQVMARRQMASVFKPVIYAAALEEGMEPCDYLDNDSLKLAGYDTWTPENFDHSFGGRYSLAGALAHSMNIPTLSLLMELGFEKVDSLWNRMGFSFALDNTPSLAFGTAEASIYEVASAYSAFANDGSTVRPQCIKTIINSSGDTLYNNSLNEPRERIISERTAMLMSAMLRKAVTEGTGTSLPATYNVTVPLAGKTGTSQDYADAWFAAFNPGIIIVSRVGASSPSIHFTSATYGTGSALALPLVALTLRAAQNDTGLVKIIDRPFPELPPSLQGALDCPDFRDKTFFDVLIDMFKGSEIQVDNDGKRKRSLLERIFRR